MSRLFEENLQTAAFEGVEFPYSEAPHEGGHDGVAHKAFGRRGADQQPTGQQPFRGSFVIPFLTDIDPRLYPERVKQFYRALADHPIGRLRHPSLGTFLVKVGTWREELTAEVGNGVVVQWNWEEHRGEAGELQADSQRVPQRGAATAEAQATRADEATSRAAPVGVNPVSPVISAQLAFLESAPRTYGEVTGAIRTMLAAVDTNLAIAALLVATPDAHDATVALEQLRGTIYQIRDFYQPQASRIRRFDVPQTMALWEVALLACGDATRTDLILPANAIPDPAAIPGGTRLIILPDA